MDHRAICRELVEGSIVLLKNSDNLLPFQPGAKVAVFGRAQLESILSGSGSGAAAVQNPANILDECEKRGLQPVPALSEFYRQHLARSGELKEVNDIEKLKEMVHSGLMYEIFGKYVPPAEELELSREMVRESAGETDTALLVFGRQSGGEECDRHLYDDYELTTSEKNLIEQVCSVFQKVAVVLNVNGLVDLNWLKQYDSIKSAIFLGVPGEGGPAALAKVLCGDVNPSGKLAFTVAKDYQDYPTYRDFSWDKEHSESILTYEDYGLDSDANGSSGFDKSPITVYREDIYLGYRYFDSFNVKPLFPFGYGLSYTAFSVKARELERVSGGCRLSVQVKNEGEYSGKEVVQLYVSPIGTKQPHPYQVLKGFTKTRELRSGESETVFIEFSWNELACYEEAAAAWVIESGSYILRLGNSSENTRIVGKIDVKEPILLQKNENRLVLKACNRGKIDFLVAESYQHEIAEDFPTLEVSRNDILIERSELHSSESFFEEFTLEELAALCVGYGPGVAWSAFKETDDPSTIFDREGKPLTHNDHPTGLTGYVSPAIPQRGIHSMAYKDGPAGIGGTAWPSEMLLACSFDVALCRKFGDAVGDECEQQKVDVWLAPAINLQRHPLGGRNFEYFSEDPFLTGSCACAVTKGVQENHPVLVCAKHFAVNEQETYRRGSAIFNFDAVDSILTERAARELYLKPFEMLVKDAELHCIMTSFNKINGVFAGGSKELCTHILREEWGFDGIVVTDWGDMDTVVDGADAVAAGNDIIMPGGPPVIHQILKGHEEKRVTRAQLEQAVKNYLSLLQKIGRYRK